MKDPLDLIANTADAVSAVCAEGRIVFWNEAATALFGFEPREVLGRLCSEVVAGRDEAGRLVCNAQCRSMMKALRHELVPAHDLLVRTKDGQERWVNASTVVVPSQWRDLFVLVHLYRDVTGEKKIHHLVKQLVSSVENLSLSPGDESPVHPPLSPASCALSDREREVLRLLAAGASTKAIAKQLFISPATVRNHVANILAKLDVCSRLEAVTLALRNRLV
jgi:PAS domain S-box-containing protein